jgi:hypothetical protein
MNISAYRKIFPVTENLVYLNLEGTEITDEGLRPVE